MPLFFSLDPLYWALLGPAMLLAMYAQAKVQSAFARWSREPVASGMTGAQAARRVLRDAGLADEVSVEESHGFLSDHYDPAARALRLSPTVFHGHSVAAVGVAAHEAGHALQHAHGYLPLQARTAIVPLASLGSWLSFPLILAGLFFGSLGLFKLGIGAFSLIVVFQLITLPVEFDASARAKQILLSSNIVRNEAEMEGVQSVLGAAALTYVAATVTAAAQLLYYLLIFAGSRDE